MSGIGAFIYTDDLLGGIRGFTTEEAGAYILLLLEQSRTGSLPTDKRRLAKMVNADDLQHFERLWETIREKFQEDEQGYYNERMRTEMEKSKARAETARGNGMRGGRPRRKPSNNPDGKLNETQQVTQTITQEQSQTEPSKKLPLAPSPLPQEQTSSEREGARATAVPFGSREVLPNGESLPAAVVAACDRWLSYLRTTADRRVAPETVQLQLAEFRRTRAWSELPNVVAACIEGEKRRLYPDADRGPPGRKRTEPVDGVIF